MKYVLAIAGNIGVGKSSLTALLVEKLGWEPLYEPAMQNPYLADFYANMKEWSFHSQVFFLSRRLTYHYALANLKGSVIQDRSVYEDAEIFARNLYNEGLMSERDWQTYYDLYRLVALALRPPDLVVYLRASAPTLLERIATRGREFEQSINPRYLEQLNSLYEEWIVRFNLCPTLIVETDGLDFVHNSEHSEWVISKITGQTGSSL